MPNDKPLMKPHGFILLMPGEGTFFPQAEVYATLRRAGFAPWDGDGRPLLVVLETHAPKHQWFEAGFFTGAGVPLFGLGAGTQFRKRHSEILSRLGGWLVQVATPADLIEAVHRRGIVPTEWDARQYAEWVLLESSDNPRGGQ